MCGYTNVLSFTMDNIHAFTMRYFANIDYDTSFDVQTEAK